MFAGSQFDFSELWFLLRKMTCVLPLKEVEDISFSILHHTSCVICTDLPLNRLKMFMILNTIKIFPFASGAADRFVLCPCRKCFFKR